MQRTDYSTCHMCSMETPQPSQSNDTYYDVEQQPLSSLTIRQQSLDRCPQPWAPTEPVD